MSGAQKAGITTATTLVDGRPMVVARIACHRCGATREQPITGKLVPEHVAKRAMRDGWIADHRFPSANRCPACAGRGRCPKPTTPAAAAPAPVIPATPNPILKQEMPTMSAAKMAPPSAATLPAPAAPTLIRPGQPTPRLVTMTPAMAQALLAGNTDNRRLRPTLVEYYAKQMREGRWVLTSDAIAVSPQGRLLNGQHRLHAVVAAGVAVTMLLVEGIDEAAFLVTDRGAGRSVSDVTGLPPGMVADISMLLYLTNGTGRRVAEQETLDWRDAWSPVFSTLAGAMHGGPKAAFNNAMLRVGAGLRWASERTPQRRAYVLAQFGALIATDLDNASKAIRVYYRRLTQGMAAKGRSSGLVGRMHLTALTFIHFDPDRSDVEPLMASQDATVAEMRGWLEMMRDAYTAGPARDGHPYLWPGKPQVDRPLRGVASRSRDAKLAREQGAPA